MSDTTNVVNVHEAKSNLSALLRRVEAGEEIIIARAGEPTARLTAIVSDAGSASRRIGFMTGLGEFWMADDFDEMDDEWLELANQGPLDSP